MIKKTFGNILNIKIKGEIMEEVANWSLSPNNTIKILIKSSNVTLYQDKVNILNSLLEGNIPLKIGGTGSSFIKEIKINKVRINKVEYFSLKIYLDKISEESYTKLKIKGLQDINDYLNYINSLKKFKI